jgi:hypothetical protein
MGNSTSIEVIDPPLDVEAMHARVRALPCVVERDRGWHEYVLAGDRRVEREICAGEETRSDPPSFGVDGGRVWLNVHWSDNAYQQGAYLMHWVLDHHRCRGQGGDGEELVDNDAIRRELRMWLIDPTLSPEARRSLVSARLVGRTLRRLDFDGFDVTLWLAADDEEDCGLRAPLDHCVVVPADPRTRGLEPDERALVGLRWRVFGFVRQIDWGDDGAMTVIDGDGDSVRFAAEWPDNKEGWRLIDPAGEVLIEAGNGGALRVAPRIVDGGSTGGADRA